jgi:hypothetical protein
MFLLFVSLTKVANTGSLVTDSAAVNIWNVNIRMYIFYMRMSYETVWNWKAKTEVLVGCNYLRLKCN